ncbi:DNA primase [Schaalia sp. lx-260]|uniref:DNA primase n=1 Tax=Schaalia sp. lx-260 TaxID=2899082 RepID=UPI001E65DB63|nr:DNA primase [Schaalia sp. lx-260]MCD4549439.1 DNA primase [Schaalia sp. lx-260]
MAGLIRREDIDAVREASRIEDIVSEHVTLRPAGVDSLKGLCPFHDERTPSFHVRPQLGRWHCFGCGEGGDVFYFIEKISHITFVEAVEFLASKTSITLHYEEGGRATRQEEPGRRQRLLDAHQIAQEFYQQQLATAQAHVGREFLTQRGFTEAMCRHFGVGYAPAGWDHLTRYLRSRGFTDHELQIAGLATSGKRGLYDRFRDRLVWPIRDITGATVGFGARRLDDSDKESPKYLNTPETPIYKKSQVLYGLDLAKKSIIHKRRIVIVEGYTDVMAAHVAGEQCAVATCGTAFGSEHVKIVRRLLGDVADPAAGVVLSDGRAHGGKVIFTFDGDAAGQKAAMRAFHEDQNFAAQTFVAVEHSGMDPCDLRMARGNEALIALIESHTPLFEFVIRSALSQMDLSTAEGRVQALRLSAPILADIKDYALRGEYIRTVAGWLGIGINEVGREVQRAGRGNAREKRVRPQAYQNTRNSQSLVAAEPVAHSYMMGTFDRAVQVERLALASLLQHPMDVVGSGFEYLEGDSFQVPQFRAVHDAIRAIGGLDAFLQILREQEALHGKGHDSVMNATKGFIDAICREMGPGIAEVVSELVVTPLPIDREDYVRSYCRGAVVAMVRMDFTRRTADARTLVQRLSPQDPQYNEAFTVLMRLEEKKRSFTERDQ